ncbi:helix-turn-helix transcriptional regulator [Streptomyces sp. bgisy027]|uniref:helix-turn-helix transcriptional regulator n=1 Tax=Streptomyces sp. bgisy027 TaxID=3413770 RepID=UPI003D71EB8D
MSEPLKDKEIAQLRRGGLLLPPGPRPGRRWLPGTPAEQHLLSEGRRLDRVRLLLLEEVGRLRQVAARIPRAEVLAAAAREAERMKRCPLSQTELLIVTGAARGETAEQTAARLHFAHDTVRTARVRAVDKLGANNMLHVVALCLTEEWVSRDQVRGVAP